MKRRDGYVGVLIGAKADSVNNLRAIAQDTHATGVALAANQKAEEAASKRLTRRRSLPPP